MVGEVRVVPARPLVWSVLCGRIIIIIKIFVWRHRVVTSEALGPGSVLVISRSMRESLREEVRRSLGELADQVLARKWSLNIGR